MAGAIIRFSFAFVYTIMAGVLIVKKHSALSQTNDGLMVEAQAFRPAKQRLKK